MPSRKFAEKSILEELARREAYSVDFVRHTSDEPRPTLPHWWKKDGGMYFGYVSPGYKLMTLKEKRRRAYEKAVDTEGIT